jgi:hypothetical protein
LKSPLCSCLSITFAATDLTHFRLFPRNLEPDFTHYLCEQERKLKSMKDTVITFLLLLPWLGRAAVSTMAVTASTHGVPKPRKRLLCLQRPSRNAVSFSSACTTKRFPSSRCASARLLGPPVHGLSPGVRVERLHMRCADTKPTDLGHIECVYGLQPVLTLP